MKARTPLESGQPILDRVRIGGDGVASLVRDRKTLVLRREGYPDGPVVGACISITSRCNESCVMCLEERDPAHPYDLPFEIASELAALFAGRVPVVNSSASEALLYPRFLDLAREISEAGSEVGVVTNGLALARPGFLASCADAGLRQVMVSCHAADESTFGTLTGVPNGFPKFVAALDALDALNRAAAAGERIRVIVESVLMKPLIGRVEQMVSFLESHLGFSRPVLRIETFRPINVARSHPELQPDLGEIAELVDRLDGSAAGRFPMTFRHVPLCLLPGREHLASEVAQILRRERTLGNASCRSTELVEQMRAQCALEQLAFAEPCWDCPLALVCPGVYDVPVRPGSVEPRAPGVSLETVAERLDPPISAEQLAGAVAAARHDRLEGAASRRFPDESMRRLVRLVSHFKELGFMVEATRSVVELAFPDPEQKEGVARVQLSPASAGGPAHRRFVGCNVVYCGERTARVDGVVDAVGRLLEREAA